jgi:hypothetical protein
MLKYKGLFVVGNAVNVHPNSADWLSQGIVFRSGPRGSVIEVERLEGDVFQTKQAAEDHGLELAKKWVRTQSRESKKIRPKRKPGK